MILVDDCSHDKSVSIIKEFQKKDSRIKFFNNSDNSGPGVSLNKGILASKGEFITFLDSDDLWLVFIFRNFLTNLFK